MNTKFKKIVDEFPVLMKQLVNSSARPWENLGDLPQKGIYVFFENKNPIYVGRSNRIKNRIKEHGRPSSTHNSAPFAFNLAKRDAEEKGVDVGGFRNELEKNPNFINLFSKAKERVSKMSIRVIGIDDPIIQTLFEVYVSIELDTKFNEFDTH